MLDDMLNDEQLFCKLLYKRLFYVIIFNVLFHYWKISTYIVCGCHGMVVYASLKMGQIYLHVVHCLVIFRSETNKQIKKDTWGGRAVGKVMKWDFSRVGWASSSSSLMVDAQREYSVLLRNPSDVALPWRTSTSDTHTNSETYVPLFQSKNLFFSISILNNQNLVLLHHSLRFWGWMSDARPSEWDLRPLTDRLLFSWWSNWPQVMCILCRVGFTPSGIIRGLLGYMWNPFLLLIMDLYTLRLLLWLWL